MFDCYQSRHYDWLNFHIYKSSFFTEYQGQDDPQLPIIIDDVVSLCPEFGEQTYSPKVSMQTRFSKRTCSGKNLKNERNSNKNTVNGRQVSRKEKLLHLSKMDLGATNSGRLIVMDGRKFICKLCGETFVSKSSSKDHANVHRGRTKCTVCRKILGSMTGLRNHMKNHLQT
jgi:hypothetical protein